VGKTIWERDAASRNRTCIKIKHLTLTGKKVLPRGKTPLFLTKVWLANL
jgi:hypothetical protein